MSVIDWNPDSDKSFSHLEIVCGVTFSKLANSF